MAHIRQVFNSISVGRGDESDLDVRRDQHLTRGFDCVIDKTWNNKSIVDHDPIKVHMQWHFERQVGKPHKRAIRVRIEAPLFDDPEGPDCLGHCGDLWNYEVVEFFFMNEKGHYLEVEVSPHGQWLVLLFKGYREILNKSPELDLEVTNEIEMDKWICNLEIPLAYMPENITRFNAYALHGSDPDRHYEAYSPVKDGSLQEPDFHRKEYFARIDTRCIIPEGYNRKPFNDLKYGNMWEALKEDED